MTIEEEIFASHAGKDVLLDSNLFLLFISGSVGPRVLGRFKRVHQYTSDDYELLISLLASFKRLITTPHILTEVSNLANSLPSYMKEEWFGRFANIISIAGKAVTIKEEWRPAAQLAALPDFVAFGLTDAALGEIALKVLIVTEDYRLTGVLRSRGLPVLNFNDLRIIKRFSNA